MARSTKVPTTDGGHAVTTIVTESQAVAITPAIIIKVKAGAKAGFTWDDGGAVTKITKGGLCDKGAVKVGWRLLSVDNDAVEKHVTKAAVAALLTAARTAGNDYTLTFASKAMEDEAEATAEAARRAAEEEALAASVAAAAAAAEAEAEAEATAEAAEAAAAAVAAEAEAARAAEEEAAEAAAAAEAAEAKRRAEEEAAEAARRLRNGKAVVVYQQYDDAFEVVDGALKVDAIDEEYCLSDAMPNCHIHLSKISPEEYTRCCQEDQFGPDFELKFVEEEPWGTFRELHTNRTYYVWVVQDAQQQALERERMSAQWEAQRAHVLASEEEARTQETCSCIEGNPCVDPYICLDWHNRIAVAKQHGFVAGASTRLF